MRRHFRSMTAGALLAVVLFLMPQNSAFAASEVFADNAYQAGRVIAENAQKDVFNTVIQSGHRLDIDEVYMATESLYPLYFSMLYYPNYQTTLDVTLSPIEPEEFILAKKEAKSVVGRIITPGMTTMERVRAIKDYIADICTYDDESAADVDIAPDRAFTAYGALIRRLAVCAGYSRAFLLLCDEANVPCVYVPAPAMNHAFNAVSLYGELRYIDVTYDDAFNDDPDNGELYFMLTGDEMGADHVWDANLTKSMMDIRYPPGYFDALKLYDLGLFQGTTKGFELDRQLTRAEAAVMLVRLLGAESDALSQRTAHPFTDVPSWADPYVGYLYQRGLTNGISATAFGSDRSTTLNDYLTFTLRALDYVDGEDFEWSNAEAFAAKTGVVGEGMLKSLSSRQINRSAAAQIGFSSLNARIKNEPQERLCDQLIRDGVIRELAAKEVGLK